MENEFHLVPNDFPNGGTSGAVAGVIPKVLLVEYLGRYYEPGTSPPERFERWEVCEDLAQQFRAKCLETKAGARAHMSECDILHQYLERLLKKTSWGSSDEMRWVIRRAAELLQWPDPKINSNSCASAPNAQFDECADHKNDDSNGEEN